MSGSNNNMMPGSINPKPELNDEIESLKTLFTEKITVIATKISDDANTINKIAEQMRAIVNKNGSASEKIKELKGLIDDVDNNENLKQAREAYQNEIENLNLALTGESSDSGKSPEDNKNTGLLGNFSNLFRSNSDTNEGAAASGFVKQIKEFAIKELKNKKIELSNTQLSKLITDKPNTVLNTTYVNKSDGQNITITPDEIIPIRESIVAEQNRLAPGRNYQAGGYLSTPRRRKRNMKSNSTRNFFKFTSKRGVKKANKKSRKKRKN